MIKKGLPEEVITEMEVMLDKPVEQLDAYEKAFLRSRVGYLTKAEKSNLGDILTEKMNIGERMKVINKLKKGQTLDKNDK